MPVTQAQTQSRIDEMMERASEQLVQREYFATERLCAAALHKAVAIRDYDRVARIVLPLQEARRQKRNLALDAGAVFLIDHELPTSETLLPGCYLVSPPRVGVDGRALRDLADELMIPVIVLVREPATRDGAWPLVAVGPVTVRAKVPAPTTKFPETVPATPAAKGRKGAKPTSKSAASTPAPAQRADLPCALPPPEWFVYASEVLGDSAIASTQHITSPDTLVEALLHRLDAQPDHEKLHQRLMDAARTAARMPERKRRPSAAASLLDEDDEEGSPFDARV